MAHSITYGWIGIGNMGYGMAMNIATKKPQKSKLFIYDVNSEQMEKFVVDASAKGVEGVETAKTPREIAERAVSVSFALTITHDLFLAQPRSILFLSPQLRYYCRRRMKSSCTWRFSSVSSFLC